MFGRSNSLSLNTGATNSLFASQNQSQQNNAPSQAGSLFSGAAGSTSQQPQSGSLFGGNNNAQTSQPGGGLFGGGSNTQTGQTGGLFGGLGQSSQAQQPQQQQQQQQQGGSLFGNSTTGGGLFGSSTAQPQQQQQQHSNSLFGGSTMGGSLFGGNKNNAQSGSLFGGNNQQQQQQPAGNSVFGLNAVPASHLNQASMLAASQYRQSQTNQFPGKLSMGQGAAPQTTNVGAVKVNYNELRSTTRFQDCIDEVKTQFEQADKMVQRQEEFCQQIQAILAKHEEDINSIDPDVALLQDKVDAVEQTLAANAQAVEDHRKTAEADRKDFDRCQRVVENLRLPAGYQMPNVSLSYGSVYGGAPRVPATPGEGAEDYDTDLVGNYFTPMAVEIQKSLSTYASNLTEIESHMRVMESTALAQAQQLAAKRAGVAGGMANGGGEDQTIRDLADTLRGFEQSILGVAGVVGQCREGVNVLVLGRLGGGGLGGRDRLGRP